MAGLISNGSFVLGDPNTRDLYLGAGLKQGDIDGKHYIAVDETVLYESNSVPNRILTFTVSERLSNFEYIRVIGYGYPDAGPQHVIMEFPAPANYTDNISICATYYCYHDDSNPLQIIGERFSTSDGLTYTIIDLKMLYWSATGTTPTNNDSNTLGIAKIIGINRKPTEE